MLPREKKLTLLIMTKINNLKLVFIENSNTEIKRLAFMNSEDMINYSSNSRLKNSTEKLLWVSTFIQLKIKDKGKLTKELTPSQPNNLQKWKAKYSIVRAWLIHIMQNSIEKKNLFCQEPRIFEILFVRPIQMLEDFSRTSLK